MSMSLRGFNYHARCWSILLCHKLALDPWAKTIAWENMRFREGKRKATMENDEKLCEA